MKPLILCLISLLFALEVFSQASELYVNLSFEELDSLADMFYEKGRFSEGLPYANAHINKAQSENNSLQKAEGLNDLGKLQMRIGNYKAALPVYLEAKDIRQKELGNEHHCYAESINDLALLYVKMGKYQEALPLYQQALAIKEKLTGKAHSSYAISLGNLAALQKKMGKYDRALSLYLQAADIYEKTVGKEHPHYATSLHNLAVIYYEMGSYSKALPLYLQVKAIDEKTLGKEHPYYAMSLENVAIMHREMGNHNLALPLYLQAKSIKEKSLGEEHPKYANSLQNLASFYEEIGNYDQALPLHLQALDIEAKALGVDHPEYAASLNNLADLHEMLGQYEDALKLYLESRDIMRKVLGRAHPSYINSLNNLASLYGKMGDTDRAWELWNETMKGSFNIESHLAFDQAWFKSLQAASDPSFALLDQMVESLHVAYQLLEADTEINDAPSKQTIVTDLANALLIEARNRVSNEEDKLHILSQSHNWLLRGLKALNADREAYKAFSLADQNKSVLLLQATMSELAFQLGDLPDSLVWRERELFRKQSRLQAKLLERHTALELDSIINELNHVNQHIDLHVRMIEQEYPKYHQVKYQQIDAEVEDIQALLAANTALLEYVVGDSVVHIFYVDQEQIQWSRIYVDNSELKERVKLLHHSLSNYQSKESYDTFREQAHWFYRNLIAEAIEDKAHINKLMIVTDGELGHLPFETFLVEESSIQPHYLLNDYSISYTYSATLWKENMEAPNPQNNGEIFGVAADYNLMPDSSMLALRMTPDQWTRGELTALPAARKEVETLQEKYEGFFAFDNLASERVVKEMASDYSILHFATHGILNKEQPVLSSLAFTEDSDSTESNFWQAHEISQAQLNADLVVLSACETGYGEFERGNGIASLARAFMYAGAPSLVVSLWQVNDEATSELMKNFYDNLDMGLKKDEALREAKLQYIKSTDGILAHPAFWSPFIVMGKTDPVEIKKKRQPLEWGFALGMLALMSIGGLIVRRKAA